MTPSHFSRARTFNRSIRPRWLTGPCGVCLLASALAGCGGQSDVLGSTDTGNPPVVIMSQKLRLTPSDNGVIVSGEAGAVPALARVDVTNVSNGQEQTTTAQADGSFAVELTGTLMDEYRVDATVGGLSSRTRLSSGGATESEAGLAGLEFLLESAEGYTLVEGTTLRLRFDASEISFDAGCNGHSGAYSLCDERLCVANLSSTLRGCEQPLMAQDGWLDAFFRSSPLVTHTGTRLELQGAEATLAFLDREVADPDRPLSGRTWTIDTFMDADAAFDYPGLFAPTVVFQADGSLQVFTTCNTGSGSYVVGDRVLTLSDVGYTEEPCDPTGNVAAHEHIRQVLTDGTVSFEIDAARLTLQRGTLGLGALTD
jgi:heat shock protein HslJ